MSKYICKNCDHEVVYYKECKNEEDTEYNS